MTIKFNHAKIDQISALSKQLQQVAKQMEDVAEFRRGGTWIYSKLVFGARQGRDLEHYGRSETRFGSHMMDAYDAYLHAEKAHLIEELKKLGVEITG